VVLQRYSGGSQRFPGEAWRILGCHGGPVAENPHPLALLFAHTPLGRNHHLLRLEPSLQVRVALAPQLILCRFALRMHALKQCLDLPGDRGSRHASQPDSRRGRARSPVQMWQGHAERASATGAHPSDGLVCCASAARARARAFRACARRDWCSASRAACSARALRSSSAHRSRQRRCTAHRSDEKGRAKDLRGRSARH
jgi:hypothetical protein